MTFKGSGIDDLQKILQQFPRDFTVQDVASYFDWSTKRTKQAIVNGQQTDSVRLVTEVRSKEGRTAYAIYENTQWRKEWLTRAWGSHGSVMDSERQEHL